MVLMYCCLMSRPAPTLIVPEGMLEKCLLTFFLASWDVLAAFIPRLNPQSEVLSSVPYLEQESRLHWSIWKTFTHSGY